MADSEPTRRQPRVHTDQEATSISMTDVYPDTHNPGAPDEGHEYPNAFQQQHQNYRQQFQQRQHYNVQIPTIDQWPDLLLRGVSATSMYSRKLVQSLKGLSPSTSVAHQASLSAEFGQRRKHPSPKRGFCCGGRSFDRLGRLFLLLCATFLILTFIFTPRQVRSFQKRDVWIRYFTHDEAIKVVLPFGQSVHVMDVKKFALQEFQHGSNMESTIVGNVKLVTPYYGRLKPDEIWDNQEWKFRSSSESPILAIETRFQLFDFLNQTLGCFSHQRAYGDRFYNIRFVPKFDDYGHLAHILKQIQHMIEVGADEWAEVDQLTDQDITYLRQGFDGTVSKRRYVDRTLPYSLA
ncbi:hypothetical protein BGZ99_000581 [Dissophora globulifera]|uniref:Uncharacterized protein n=1 Tax=Dissophora globulifera TaxID=979702 RepID=A0A9P6R125_9FUNG|nr:hypothetical protein BGZ99_000581 [Dissophora globulifera]